MEGKNNDAIRNGLVSDEISEKYQRKLGERTGRNLRKKFGEELSVDQEQPDDNQGGIFGADGDRRVRFRLDETEEERVRRIEKENQILKQLQKMYGVPMQEALGSAKKETQPVGDGEEPSVNRRFSKKDTSSVPKDISDFVDKALFQRRSNDSIVITTASQIDNKRINRLGNELKGSYAGAARTFTGEYIRHIMNQHADPIIEALRGQLYMDGDAIKIALSNLREGKGTVIAKTYSEMGEATILTEIPINGYTLYAELPEKEIDGIELHGRTIYMAPTSARTLIRGKVPVNISQRRSGSHNNSIHRYGQNVNSFLKISLGVMRF